MKVALVTGATSGLGLAVTRRLLAAGYAVHGVSRTQNAWDQARTSVGENKHFTLHQHDLSDEKAVKTLIANVITDHPHIDLLINSAGYAGPLVRTEAETLAEFEHTLRHNLTTTFLVCKYALPSICSSHGTIVNVASMAGVRAVPRLAAYSASKFGVLALSQAIAKENEQVMRCFTVCPGGINTPMRERLFGTEDAERQQSADYVADVMMQAVTGTLAVDSGGDIIVRHGQITAIRPVPAP